MYANCVNIAMTLELYRKQTFNTVMRTITVIMYPDYYVSISFAPILNISIYCVGMCHDIEGDCTYTYG